MILKNESSKFIADFDDNDAEFMKLANLRENFRYSVDQII